MGRLNRSSCRSFIKVRSDHQRSGVVLTTPLSPPLGKGLKQRGSSDKLRVVAGTMARPEGGKGSASHTKTLTEGEARSQLHPSHIGEGLVRVDVSLFLSLRQRKNTIPRAKPSGKGITPRSLECREYPRARHSSHYHASPRRPRL